MSQKQARSVTAIKAARIRTGLTQRDFAKEVHAECPDIRPQLYNEIEGGKVNPVAEDAANILWMLGLSFEDVRNAPEWRYPLLEGKPPTRRKHPENRKLTAKVTYRTTPEQKGLFMAACAAAGITMQEALDGFMRAMVEDYEAKKKTAQAV